MRDGLKMDAFGAIEREKAASMEKFALFNSPHEGCAVILEGVEELRDELDGVRDHLQDLWECAKSNTDGGNHAALLYDKAKIAACEAIQVAAMASKYLESNNAWKRAAQ